jgi:branched-chain amino acid transport system substrate-binding protein
MNTIKLMHRTPWRSIPSILLIAIAALLLTNCSKEQPVLVGFAGQLTGIQAELGVQERNGVQLAMGEVNAAGGIAGRPVELMVQDDLGTTEGAQAADRALIKAGVVAIIGHPTSSQSLAGLVVTNPAEVIMLSPTTSTPALSGKDDYFFRVVQPIAAQAIQSAQHIFQNLKRARIAVIYGTDNAAYTTAYLDAFAEAFESLGGTIVARATFSSKTQPDFSPLITQLRESNPDQLLIIAADADTALIAQRARLMDWQIPLYTTSWAQTETLINNGGKAVEGMGIELTSAFNKQNPEYQDFAKRYQAKFGRSPSFGAVMGYEAAKMLALALRETGGNADGLKQTLINMKEFQGLSDTVHFDEYGDALRPIHIGAIRNGKYVSIDAIPATQH